MKNEKWTVKSERWKVKSQKSKVKGEKWKAKNKKWKETPHHSTSLHTTPDMYIVVVSVFLRNVLDLRVFWALRVYFHKIFVNFYASLPWYGNVFKVHFTLSLTWFTHNSRFFSQSFHCRENLFHLKNDSCSISCSSLL